VVEHRGQPPAEVLALLAPHGSATVESGTVIADLGSGE
jgi:hypothetical protein